jgi:hypothetical protein
VHIAIFGAGLVGQRTARALVAHGFKNVVLISQTRQGAPSAGVTVGQGWPHPEVKGADIVVLATESAHQPAMAIPLVKSGIHVVTTADNPADIKQLWALDDTATEAGAALVIGAAYSPGLSTLLASYLVRTLDTVDTISTAQFGTGGPACAQEHHRAMGSTAHEVHEGVLRTSRGGSGRELVWFPDPVAAADCYRAGLADPFLLHQAFPTVRRIESRQAATRRDRLTSRLPMLRPPHAEGLVGAVWAEVRGHVDGRAEHRAMAATAPQATGAAAMAAAVCCELAGQLSGEDGEPDFRRGAQSAASNENPVSLLQLVSNDVRLWAYDGSQIVTASGETEPIHAARKWRSAGENVAIAMFFQCLIARRGSFA